jgi:hypothetical protein
MSTNSQSSVPAAWSSSREPLTATPDPVKGVWPLASSSSDRSKSTTSEADSVFSASSRPTNETTPELLDIESKASAVQHWATAQSPRTVAGDELASRLSAAAAGQQKHTSTSAALTDDSPNAVLPTNAAPPSMTSAIPTKAVSPSATTNPFPKIPVAGPTANPKGEIPRKPIIKLKRFLAPELRDKPVKKYTSKKAFRKDDSDPYNYPEGSGSETCSKNQLNPNKKKEKHQTKKLKPTLSSVSPATVDNDSGDEPTKKNKLPKDQQRRVKKLKPAPSPTTAAFSATTDNGSDSEYTPKPKKRKSPLLEKKEQPAAKKPKTKASPPFPGPSSSSSSSTEKPTTPASSASSADRPKQHYELRAAEILRSPLDYDDCVRDDVRPGKAQRIRRVFRRFRREQGEPISTAIGGARNPPDPETDVGGEKWGTPYQRGGDGGILVGWVKNKARRIWGGEVNKSASEYAKKR